MSKQIVRNGIVALMFAVLICGEFFEVRAIPGESDRTFASNSLYTDPNPQPQAPFFQRTGFADGKLTADGSLISFGTFIGADASGYGGNIYDFYLQKLRPNGTLDTSFGTNGTKRIHLWEGRSYGSAIKIQPDNKIVIAGYCFISTNFGTPTQHQSGFGICAMRLQPDGSLDSSFGGNAVSVPELSFSYNMPAGTVFFASNQSDSEGQGSSGANAVDLAANGDIILAGISHFQNDPAFPNTASNYATVVRLNSGGALLNITRVSDPVDTSATTRTNRGREFNAVGVQSDGKVIAVGESQVFSDESKRIFAVRISTTGSVENTFVGDSIVGNTAGLSVTFTRSNKFVVAGGIGNTPLMYRFNSNFTLDPTFGSGGRIAYCYNGQPVCSDRYTSYDQQSYIKIGAIQTDGKMVALMGNFAPGLSYTYFARFNPDGSYDRSLGTTSGQGSSIYNYGSVYTYPFINGQFVGYTPNFLTVRPNGRIISGGQAPVGNGGLYQGALTQLVSTPMNQGILSDFNNDGKTDVSVYRASAGVWYDVNSFNGSASANAFGLSTDKLAPADYDGDGKTDRAIFRDGVWWISQSSNGQIRVAQYGSAGDLPRPGDFNGDGFADLVVFRPSNGIWYIQYSNLVQPGNITENIVQFGQNGDVPLMADFDGDGRSDVSVFRNGVWYFIRSSDNSVGVVQFGLTGDVPVVGDYDADGKADIAVFRSGIWYVLRSSDNQVMISQFGIAGDRPVPGDYDSDGKNDFAIYRNGIWWIQRSTDNVTTATSFGLSSDIPVPTAYLP
ncbi:hypothetical protein BH10ACI3_BH10ACI3_09110 [soil metagenome]